MTAICVRATRHSDRHEGWPVCQPCCCNQKLTDGNASTIGTDSSCVRDPDWRYGDGRRQERPCWIALDNAERSDKPIDPAPKTRKPTKVTILRRNYFTPVNALTRGAAQICLLFWRWQVTPHVLYCGAKKVEEICRESLQMVASKFEGDFLRQVCCRDSRF